MTSTDTRQFVADPAALAQLCQSLQGARWLAVDTEFIREKTYYPQLCLIQIATDDGSACIDPLAIGDLQPLYRLLLDTNITKVFHSCRQDQEIFFHILGRVPAPIFDTQVAAPLLGYPPQVGYANLVEEMLGVRLSKEATRSNWAHRPLSRMQLDYAHDDVIFLCRLYHQFVEQLARLHREDWLAPDMRALEDPELFVVRAESAWQKIRGAHRLSPAQIARIQSLAAWRETKAQELDRPRGWIVKDDLLIDIARLKTPNMSDLERLRGVTTGFLQRFGAEVIGAARGGPEAAPSPAASQPGPRIQLEPHQETLVEAMGALLKHRAWENRIHPDFIASRKDLSRLVAGETDVEVLSGWRRQIIGEELLKILAGQAAIYIDHRSIETVPPTRA